MGENSYSTLINKLDEFIRKYYKNQLIRGSIYAAGSIVLFFLSLSVLEYFAHFDSIVRTILFYSFILTTVYIAAKFIALPASKLYKLGNIISHNL